MKRILVVSLLLVCSLWFSMSANGSSQAGGQMHFKPEEIKSFAKKVEKSIAQKGALVAVIARVGRPKDKLPQGIGYTHTAIAVYSEITTADNRKIPGYAIYNLYQRDKEPNVSDLVQDFPIDFFAGVEVLEAGIAIPSPELQERILKVIVSPTYKELHNPRYSVIANPFTLEYQNCTEHTLDVIFSAIYDTGNIRQIKKNEEAYFQPQPINVSPVKLAIGSMFVSEIATSDHPKAPATATFETIAKFLQKYDAGSEVYTVLPDK